MQDASPPGTGVDTAGPGGRRCVVELAILECGVGEFEDGERAGDTAESRPREMGSVICGLQWHLPETGCPGGGGATSK